MTAGAAALAWAVASVQAQSPVIASFGRNGELVCTNLQPGSTASVVWAASLLGPWTNSPPGLDAVTADTNGAIRVNVPVLSWSVPMFCRVWGTPPTTNPPTPASMVLIPAGWFTMGDSFYEGQASLPRHSVYVSAFYIDQFEVTKALWDEVVMWANTNGYDLGVMGIGLGKATNHPVHTVAWFDCVKWCNARSEKEGREPAYYRSAALTTVYRAGGVDVQNDWVKWTSGYRLPTEAEWEKAARGGAIGQRFPWTGTNNITHSQANYYSDPRFAYDTSPTRGYHPSFQAGGEPYTSPVGYFAPNDYGLYDMAGNLYEWCWDWYGSYTASPATDPRGPISGAYRLIRGSGWDGDAFGCRAAYRNDYVPSSRYSNFGFRTALAPGQP